MADYDDLFEQPQDAPAPEFNKEAWATQKKEQREGLYALSEQTAVALSDPAKFRQYLDVQGQFSLYSVNNALLIATQMPEARQLKDFGAWKEQGVSVQKGARGIQILEPGKPYQGDDGQKRTSVNVKRVFDISQTDAQPTPAVQRDERKLLQALVRGAPIPCVVSEQVPEGKAAHFDGKAIQVRRGCEAQDLFREIAAEMGVAKLGDPLQARCAAYLLCRRYNMKPPDISRVPEGFRGGDPQAIRGELGKIRDAADAIGKRMYRNLEPKREARS